MLLLDFPKCSQAPKTIQALDGPCGPLAAWGVLRYFRKRTSVARLLKACSHTNQQGTFAIALAVALREHQVWVEFYAEPDPLPHAIEKHYHQRAAELGIDRREPPELETILSLISPDCIPILLYNADDNIGHFSPIVGIDGDQVAMPYTDERLMAKAELQNRWSAPDILRQCILVRQGKVVNGTTIL